MRRWTASPPRAYYKLLGSRFGEELDELANDEYNKDKAYYNLKTH
jgi:hypothetical protein